MHAGPCLKRVGGERRTAWKVAAGVMLVVSDEGMMSHGLIQIESVGIHGEEGPARYVTVRGFGGELRGDIDQV